MSTLSQRAKLPAPVLRSAIGPGQVRPGIVHLGLGAFHRAHQAIFTEDAIAASGGDWGIIGVSLRSHDIVDALKAQDMLYSVTVRQAASDTVRVVATIVDALAASLDPHGVLNHLADPAIRIVSLTVTEKAYGLDPATGGLDRNHPAVRHDLQTPEMPVGVIGYLVAGLARRYAAGHLPFTVLCCDNLPENGKVVRRLVLEMAHARSRALADWIAQAGAFPCTMVDRIVPAASEMTRARAASLLGVEDCLALETEDFSQWVIEDNFVAGRPDWAAAGALFVSDVAPYEKMKLRLLNGAHSLIGYLGQWQGLDYVRDVMANPAHVARVRAHMQAVAATLAPVPGIDIAHYIEQLLARFANPAIAHRTAQIAMDGSQKMPQRIFAPALEALAAGTMDATVRSCADVTALWLRFLQRADSIDDPRADELLQAARVSQKTRQPYRAFLDVPGLFPPGLVHNTRWHVALDEAMGRWSAEK